MLDEARCGVDGREWRAWSRTPCPASPRPAVLAARGTGECGCRQTGGAGGEDGCLLRVRRTCPRVRRTCPRPRVIGRAAEKPERTDEPGLTPAKTCTRAAWGQSMWPLPVPREGSDEGVAFSRYCGLGQEWGFLGVRGAALSDGSCRREAWVGGAWHLSGPGEGFGLAVGSGLGGNSRK